VKAAQDDDHHHEEEAQQDSAEGGVTGLRRVRPAAAGAIFESRDSRRTRGRRRRRRPVECGVSRMCLRGGRRVRLCLSDPNVARCSVCFRAARAHSRIVFLFDSHRSNATLLFCRRHFIITCRGIFCHRLFGDWFPRVCLFGLFGARPAAGAAAG